MYTLALEACRQEQHFYDLLFQSAVRVCLPVKIFHCLAVRYSAPNFTWNIDTFANNCVQMQQQYCGKLR